MSKQMTRNATTSTTTCNIMLTRKRVSGTFYPQDYLTQPQSCAKKDWIRFLSSTHGFIPSQKTEVVIRLGDLGIHNGIVSVQSALLCVLICITSMQHLCFRKRSFTFSFFFYLRPKFYCLPIDLQTVWCHFLFHEFYWNLHFHFFLWVMCLKH